MAPLVGLSYLVDTSEVYTYITKFVACNHTAEAKIQLHLLLNDGRTNFITLKNHFEAVGVNSIAILSDFRDTALCGREETTHMVGRI